MLKIISCILLIQGVQIAESYFNTPEKIDKLSFKVGEWKWDVAGLTTPGDPKMYKGVGYSKVYYSNDSTSIIDEHKIDWENGIDYKAITFRTFDQATKKYMVVWAQSNSSNTSKIEGYWEGEKFVEIETGTDNYGEWTNRLEIFDIQPHSHIAKLVRTYNSGFKLTILEYSASRIMDTK